MEWAILPLKKYADFTGRAHRKEYWSFAALVIAFMTVVIIVERLLGLKALIGPYGPLTALSYAIALLPMIAVGVRRLHDTERSGWWLMISYGPMILVIGLMAAGLYSPGMYPIAMIFLALGGIGSIVLLIFMVLRGTRGPNRYGPDPQAGEGASPGAA